MLIYNMETQKTNLKNGNKLFLNILLVLILILQGGIFYLILNPINLYNQLTTVQVINNVVKTVSIPPNELPQVGIIGDKKNLQDIETLKKGNSVDAEIYKDAKNGDYVLGYTSKLIIYRPNDKSIVYEGDTPQLKVNKAQQNLIGQVQKTALDNGLITKDTSVPQASVVTDPTKVKSSNPFYKDVEQNDIIANFSNPDLIVIYRPSTDKIIKSGQVQLNIK
jgi:hypothetical protein